MSISVIIGIDEAGRGPLAGPVVAGACHLSHVTQQTTKGWMIDNIRIADSKMMDEEEREAAYAWITSHCAWGVAAVSNTEIDRMGILEATNLAMQQAVSMLAETVTPTYLLVDGRDAFWFDYPHSSVIRGDSLEPAIAAASIIAKVTRDRWMREQDAHFPLYGFADHKGYASPLHIEMIRAHGPCPLHRLYFLRNHNHTPKPTSGKVSHCPSLKSNGPNP